MRFSQWHPLTQLLLCFSAAVSGILNRSPIFLAVSFFLAFFYRCFQLRSGKIAREFLEYISLTLFFTVLIPLFAHNGKTPLLFINDNAVTAESVLRGLCIGLQVNSAICWLRCMAFLLNAERVIYLLSWISPAFAVFVSGMLRFLPQMKKRYKSIFDTQKSIYPGKKGLFKKIKLRLKSLSAVVSWAIESTADTHEAMYARGYGLSGRTSLSLYRFRKADMAVTAAIAYVLPFTAASLRYGTIGVRFYPEAVFTELTLPYIMVYVLWTAVMLIPLISEICEEYKWILLRSKI